MTFQDPGARTPVDIQVRLRSGNAPPAFDPDTLPEYKTPETAAPPQAEPAFDPDTLPEYTAPPPRETVPEIGTAEAGARGIINAATFGMSPAIDALGAAAGPEWHQSQAAHDFSPIVGAAKLLHSYLAGHPDDQVRKDYAEGREKAEETEQEAGKSWAYTGGQVIGSLLTPVPGLGGAASVGGRLVRAGTSGALGGGLYGAGSAISEGQSPGDIAKSAAEGAGTGALFGGAAGGALEGVSGAAGKALSLVRGVRDPEAEAARRVVDALRSDYERAGQQWTPEMIDVANEAGIPRSIVDQGGERTRALERSAANTSPEARAAVDEMTRSRFEQQSPRMAAFIKHITGAGDAGADRETLRQAARIANKPRYQRAYAAGDRPIWSNELQRLADTSPTVKQAMRDAEGKWGDWQAIDGFGAAKPSVRMGPGGTLQFTNARGIPTYPNIQYMDYAARELAEKAEKARTRGADQEAARFGGLENMFKGELDKLVPEYKDARATAAAFFGARDASEAGQKFVMSNADVGEARRALAKMSEPERELFARGFASELANRIEGTGDRQNIINSIFLNNKRARDKISMVLGPERAAKIETALRVETLVDKARQALTGSTTARQLAEAGLAGVGVAGFESLKEGKFNAATLLSGALAAGATVGARHGVKAIDEKVTRHVGEMLASNNSAVLNKGISIVTKSPVFLNAIRAATGAASRVGTQDLGFTRAAAGIGALLASPKPKEEE